MALGGKRAIEIDVIAYDKASQVFNRIGDGMNRMAVGFNNGVIELNKGLHRYNSAMRGVNRITQIALTGAGYSVYRFTKESVNAFADFEKQHAKTMGAIAGNYDKSSSSQKKFIKDQERLKKESMKLGTVGPDGNGALYNPVEVSYAQTELSKSGFKQNEISSALPDILKFAGGNDLDIETAATYGVNMSSMFNIKPENLGSVFDKLTKTADMSAIDVPDIFESLKYAGPLAAQSGRDLEEVLSMIAIMGNAGLRGSTAGTGVQAFYTKLLSPVGKGEQAMKQAPTLKARKALEDYVAGVTDAEGNMKDGPELSDELTKAMDQLNDREQSWFAHKLFGLYQMKAGFTLSKPGTGDLMKDMIEEIKNESEGSNDKKWQMMLETSYGRKMALKNAVFGVKTDVGYRLAPMTKAITDELFKAISSQGNYNIDFGSLKRSIKESSKLIEEQYGKQIANGVEELANFGLDAGRSAIANAPLLEGYTSGVVNLLNGDVTGAIDAFRTGIQRANENIELLPPELQPFAENVKTVTLALIGLSGVNFAAKLLENITTIWRSTIGQIIKAANMNVTANNVVIKDTGIVDKDGNPIYKQDTTDGKPPKGGTGGGGTILGADGKPLTGGNTKGTKGNTGGGSVFVDKNGNPIGGKGGNTTAKPKPNIGGKIAGGFNKLTMIYALGEMLGFNSFVLDKMGVEGETREKIDRGRTVADGVLTAGMLDKVLLGGKGTKILTNVGKHGGKLVSGIGKGLYAGMSESVATVTGSVGGTIAAVGAGMVTLSMAMLVDGAKKQLQKEKEFETIKNNKDDNYHLNTTGNKNPWYNPNGVFIQQQPMATSATKVAKDRVKEKRIEFLMPAKPSYKWYSPTTWKNKGASEDWNKQFAENQKTREQLQAKMTSNTKTIMDSISPMNMKFSDVMSGLAQIRDTPPVVNVAPPMVNVNVKVDKSGNVTTNKYITGGSKSLSEDLRLFGPRIGLRP